MARHLDRYPPGDFLLQMLVATLCSMVGGLAGGKAGPFDFAPWLRSPEDRAALKLREQQQRRSNRRVLVSRLSGLRKGKRA